jgi:hypothetical protein
MPRTDKRGSAARPERHAARIVMKRVVMKSTLTRGIFWAALLLVSSVTVAPVTLEAQWIEPPGKGWTSLTLYHQDTSSAYSFEGDKGTFPADGHAVATSSFLTVALGLVEGVDAWAQFSFQRLRFDDISGRSTSTGVGDVRLYARTAPLRLFGVTTPVAIRGGVKLPAGDFDVGTNLIPLGDGQRDWELMLEFGHSFYPNPTYIAAWVGHRWRESSTQDDRDFGNEQFFYAAVGGVIGPVGYKAAIDGWYGNTPILAGLAAPGAKREMLRVSPSLLIPLGPGQVEIGTRVPLAGKNLPAGTDLVIGYFTRLGF